MGWRSCRPTTFSSPAGWAFARILRSPGTRRWCAAGRHPSVDFPGRDFQRREQALVVSCRGSVGELERFPPAKGRRFLSRRIRAPPTRNEIPDCPDQRLCRPVRDPQRVRRLLHRGDNGRGIVDHRRPTKAAERSKLARPADPAFGIAPTPASRSPSAGTSRPDARPQRSTEVSGQQHDPRGLRRTCLDRRRRSPTQPTLGSSAGGW